MVRSQESRRIDSLRGANAVPRDAACRQLREGDALGLGARSGSRSRPFTVAEEAYVHVVRVITLGTMTNRERDLDCRRPGADDCDLEVCAARAPAFDDFLPVRNEVLGEQRHEAEQQQRAEQRGRDDIGMRPMAANCVPVLT